MITITEQIDCVQRELLYRRRVYARRVEQGKMTQQLADREIKRMSAVLETLQGVKLKSDGPIDTEEEQQQRLL